MGGRVLIASGVAIAGLAAPAAAQLMIPDSGGDRVMLFSKADGSLLNPDFITDAGAVGWAFTTPKDAIVVGNEIWVSDQVQDAVFRFHGETREYLGRITEISNGGVLDNIRGMGFDGQIVYVTNYATSSTIANRGVAMYSPSGTPLGLIQFNGHPFDVEPFQGGLLISNETTNAVERWSTEGHLEGVFASNIVYPQHVATMADGSVITVSTIAASGIEGVYHFNADGSLRTFIDTEVLKGQIGEHVPRAAWLLEDGGYLIASGDGVVKAVEIQPGVFTFIPILMGVDAQLIGELAFGAACLADWDGSGGVNSADISAFLSAWLASVNNGDLNADFDNSGGVNSADISAFLSQWLADLAGGEC